MTIQVDEKAMQDMCEEMSHYKNILATLLLAIYKLKPSSRRELARLLREDRNGD